MIKPDTTLHINSFIQNELSQAEVKRGKLLNALNTLALLSYDRGNRNVDVVIREKVGALTGEIDQYYRTIRSFTGGKAANRFIFSDILLFFDERYLTHNKLAECLAVLKQEIDLQLKRTNEDGTGGASSINIRRDNMFLEELTRDLIKWELVFTSNVSPYLTEFLVDINEILLYHRLNEAINSLLNGNEIFVRDGEEYREFKNGILRYAEYHLMLTRIALPDAKMEDLINQTLQRMGFRNIILKSKNISPEKYREMIGEIVKEGKFAEFAERFAPAYSAALDAIKRLEQKK